MASIRAASLSAFTQALDTSETAFVRRRVYLALERARELVLRNLFRKVFLLGERTERTRVRVQEFSAGVQVSEDMADNWEQSVAVDLDEIECLVAGLIYKVRWPKIFPLHIASFKGNLLRVSLIQFECLRQGGRQAVKQKTKGKDRSDRADRFLLS